MATTTPHIQSHRTMNSDSPSQEASETTPLLSTEASSSSTITTIHDGPVENTKDPEEPFASSDTSDPEPPLPKSQLFLLCYIRLVEPIAFFSIFPFINAMVARNGNIPPASVGFYSGLIESLFSLTQMLVMVFWGKASDRFGRKPVLVFSVAGVSVASAAFGLATTIWQMIVLRCLAGIFAGTIVTIRTMFGELSTSRTQARAFSYFAFAGNVGIFLGPLLGGALADPATQYGGFWKDVRFFIDYPYALSTFLSGLFGVTATLVGAFFVKETMHLKKKPASADTRPNETSDPTSNNSPDSSPKPLPILTLLRSPGVPTVLFLFAHVMLLAFAYTAITPVYWYTPRPLGGLGFTSLQISLMMAVTGAAQAIWLLLVFPPLQRRLGTRGVLRACGAFYPLFLACVPLAGILLWRGDDTAEIVFWVIMPPLLCLGVGVSMAFTGVQLALNAVCPGEENASVLNSVALALVSGVRAFTPFAFSSLFAVGVERGILGGQLAWVVLAALAAAWAVATGWLPEATDDRMDQGR